jgi:hypothetical protein
MIFGWCFQKGLGQIPAKRGFCSFMPLLVFFDFAGEEGPAKFPSRQVLP